MVNVTNANDHNVSGEQETIFDVKNLLMSDKLLNVLMLCKDEHRTKRDFLRSCGY